MNIVSTKFQSFGIYLGALQPGRLPQLPCCVPLNDIDSLIVHKMSLMAPFRLPPVSSPRWAVPSEQSQNGVNPTWNTYLQELHVILSNSMASLLELPALGPGQY